MENFRPNVHTLATEEHRPSDSVKKRYATDVPSPYNSFEADA